MFLFLQIRIGMITKDTDIQVFMTCRLCYGIFKVLKNISESINKDYKNPIK